MSRMFDSNILIYHLNEKLDVQAEAMLEQALEEGAYISVITRIEVLGWPGQSVDAFRRAKSLLDQFLEQALTNEIADRCIALRQQRRITIPDAVVAATAQELNLPLVTRNTDDFRWIEGLELINPFEPAAGQE
jgi:predicted nucleic acid-binding protein